MVLESVRSGQVAERHVEEYVNARDAMRQKCPMTLTGRRAKQPVVTNIQAQHKKQELPCDLGFTGGFRMFSRDCQDCSFALLLFGFAV